jgi:hypothetical protein
MHAVKCEAAREAEAKEKAVTIAGLRRKFPTLVRKAESSTRLTFTEKPRLVITPRGRPKADDKNVYIPRRLARDSTLAYAELVTLHELREILFGTHGCTQNDAHSKAIRHERRDLKRLGLNGNRYSLWRKYTGKPNNKTRSTINDLSRIILS